MPATYVQIAHAIDHRLPSSRGTACPPTAFKQTLPQPGHQHFSQRRM